jgi:CheY-like chemotaxis protein
MGLFDFFKKKPRPILVIDDQVDVRDLLKDALESFGLRVIVAEGGADGVKMAQAQQPQLILLDIRMPSMDGQETLTILKHKESTRDIPVLMVTGEAQGSDIEQAFKKGAAGYVLKPLDMSDFLTKLQKFVQLP